MSKSSTVTVRETPVSEVSSATAGGLMIHGETLIISTDERIEVVDLTDRVMTFVRRLRIREGLVSLWPPSVLLLGQVTGHGRSCIRETIFLRTTSGNPPGIAGRRGAGERGLESRDGGS